MHQNEYGIFVVMQDKTEAQLKSSISNKDATHSSGIGYNLFISHINELPKPDGPLSQFTPSPLIWLSMKD